MKIAFLCEGYSEHDSVDVILKKFTFSSYRYLKEYSDGEGAENGVYYIYRHNYKCGGRIRPEYLGFSKLLIDKYDFSKVFVWFDNGNEIPVCEYAKEQYSYIGAYKGKIDLVLSVKCLENWYLANIEILSKLIGNQIDLKYLASLEITNFLNTADIDALNAKKVLARMKPNSPIEHFTRPKTACRFFSLIDPDLEYSSSSFSRFLAKMKEGLA